ncbi:hypothetical protein LX32DRAFT_684499 [Colletotrichum zoysiae]|uniref:AAA+ ATPase domain-containing protein n=1 Tax=Colletotrichum zoysiae TaxID=1216348 RepID=A0AAD9LZE5_9PEZI|nr:hypothetical protein LX32DRAFT_684499 [Colletotrichum zoysiae]
MVTGTDLWDKAFQALNPDIQKHLNQTSSRKRGILDDVLKEADAQRRDHLRKRWKFTKPNGDTIIVRDVLEKIVGWVQRFKEAGDIIVQYDPGHGALPWAAIRFLLQIAVSDVELFAALVDDLEYIARMMVRYRVFENLYLRGLNSEIELSLEDALTRLYAEILTHLSKAIEFLCEKTLVRVLKSPFRTVDKERAKALRDREIEVDKFKDLADTDTLRSLEKSFVRLSTQSYQRLTETRFNDILEWLSVAPYHHHHQFLSQPRPPSAGQWLLNHPDYLAWQNSSYPALLLVHGIPGSGKSTLCSMVVDCLRSTTDSNPSAAPFGDFYCATQESEKARRSSDDVMRTLLFQLALDSTHPTKMREVLSAEYQRQLLRSRAGKLDLPRLITKDCVRLILELAEQDPLTIVVDGIDTVDDNQRPILIQALREIIGKADNVVKVLVTGRSSNRAAALPTAEFRVHITSQETTTDMEAFIDQLVETAVTRKLLLEGRIGSDARKLLRKGLLDGAGEMFLWAKLQMERICRITDEDDILEVLKKYIPQDIDQIYQETVRLIMESGESTRTMAIKVLSWVLYIREPLKPRALLAALSIGENREYDLDQVMIKCSNLVVLDTKSGPVFYPAPGAGFEIPSDDFYVYATIYWPVHTDLARSIGNDTTSSEVLTRKVASFIFNEDWEPSLSFDSWVETAQCLVPLLPQNHVVKRHLDAASNSAPGPLFVLSIFGMDEILDLALTNNKALDANRRSKLGHTPVYLAAAFGRLSTVELLVKHGANTNTVGGKFGSPLHAASYSGYSKVVESLLQLGVDVNCGSVFKNALKAAFRGGQEDVALLLIERQSIIETQVAYNEALDDAALVGLLRVVQTLQLLPLPFTKKGAFDGLRSKIRKAIQGGQVGVLRQFLSRNADNLELLPPDALSLATLHNHKDMEQKLTFAGPTETPFTLRPRMGTFLSLDYSSRRGPTSINNLDSMAQRYRPLPTMATSARSNSSLIRTLMSAKQAISKVQFTPPSRVDIRTPSG